MRTPFFNPQTGTVPGYSGLPLGMHRALRHRVLRPANALAGLGIAAAFVMLQLALYPWLVRAWDQALQAGVSWLHLAVKVRHWPVVWSVGSHWAVDRLVLAGPLPVAPWWGLLTVAVLGLIGWLLVRRLPDAYTPVAYALRLLIVLVWASLAYFAFWGEHFPYRLADHTRDIYAFNVGLQVLVPVVLALTLFPIVSGTLHRLLACAVVQGYFVLTLPIKLLAHGWLATHLGAVALPLLFLAWGPVLDVLLMVALYAWVATWFTAPDADEDPA